MLLNRNVNEAVDTMGAEVSSAQALKGAKPAVFWSDRPDGPPQASVLSQVLSADLTVVGGGFTGLWAAIQALEDQPGIEVAVLEAERCGFGASSRNGGFCNSSLNHGLENGLLHWPDEIDVILRLGRDNLNAIEEAGSCRSRGRLRPGDSRGDTSPFSSRRKSAGAESRHRYRSCGRRRNRAAQVRL